MFKVTGLDDGTYNLIETLAPSGYNAIADPIEVVITASTANNQEWTGTAADALMNLAVTADGAAGTADAESGTAQITVVNNKGITLPGTGGIGTTVFYITGGIIAAGSAVLLITRKRMQKSEDK